MKFAPSPLVLKIYSWIISALALAIFFSENTYGQDRLVLPYTMQDVLAHNDYQKDNPFYNAYKHRVGIIEADLLYHEGKVIVAHDNSELVHEWDLEEMYLKPILKKIEENGSVYPDSVKSMALMLDIKNEPSQIMDWILMIVKRYPALFGNGGDQPRVSLIISGHRPPIESWANLPSSVYIDGRLSDSIPGDLRHKVFMISSSLASVVPGSWSPVRLLPAQIDAVRKAVDSVHKQNIKIRFWGVPDNFYFWKLQSQLKVDIVGSDQLSDLDRHLKNP